METNSLGPWTIEKERGSRLQYVLSEFIPRIPFREYALRKAFSAIAAVGLLDDFEYQLGHMFMIRHTSTHSL
jgi:hypothetical protein